MSTATENSKDNRRKPAKNNRTPQGKKSSGLRVLALVLALAMVASLVAVFIQSLSW